MINRYLLTWAASGIFLNSLEELLWPRGEERGSEAGSPECEYCLQRFVSEVHAARTALWPSVSFVNDRANSTHQAPLIYWLLRGLNWRHVALNKWQLEVLLLLTVCLISVSYAENYAHTTQLGFKWQYARESWTGPELCIQTVVVLCLEPMGGDVGTLRVTCRL